ncbi:MAG: nucleotidyltransferase domain-containing protein [Thermoproteales archaeon]|nr:nucleotidyltransferase domain-containing protein [Thermoproteales archaeon]
MSLELETYEKFRFYELEPREKERIFNELKMMLSGYGEVLLAVIYGSFLKNYPLRDIDVALYICGEDDPLDYKFRLDKVLSERLGYPVDVRILNNAPSWFILEVLENGKVLVDKVPGMVEKLYKKALDEKISMKRRIL